jgi:hypothetical protein
MVLVTHDSTVAARAQRVGLMRDGLLTVAQPANQPSNSASFAGHCGPPGQPGRITSA